MGAKTKIDWCESTWNPVTGCLHGCEYCYARRIAERFGANQMPIFADYPVLHEPVRCTDTYAYMRDAGISTGKIQPYPFGFLPTFHRYKLDEPQHWKKPLNGRPVRPLGARRVDCRSPESVRCCSTTSVSVSNESSLQIRENLILDAFVGGNVSRKKQAGYDVRCICD